MSSLSFTPIYLIHLTTDWIINWSLGSRAQEQRDNKPVQWRGFSWTGMDKQPAAFFTSSFIISSNLINKDKKSHCKALQGYLREQRSLLSFLLQAVSHEPLHGFGAVTAHFAQVRGEVTSAHHEDDLQQEEGIKKQCSAVVSGVHTACLVSSVHAGATKEKTDFLQTHLPGLCCWCWSKATPPTWAHTGQYQKHRHLTESCMGSYPAIGSPQEPARE